MSIGCVAIAGGPQDVVSSSGALWEHQTAETARGRKWCIRYRVTGLRNSVLAISNADWGILSVAVRSSFRSVSTSGTVEIEASVTRPPRQHRRSRCDPDVQLSRAPPASFAHPGYTVGAVDMPSIPAIQLRNGLDPSSLGSI